MLFSDDDLRAAAAAGLIEARQTDALLAFLASRQAATATPRFDAPHLLWYAGTLIVMGAMGIFSTLAFSAMGGWTLAAIAIVYAAIFVAAGHWFWHRKSLPTLGGLLVAVAVSMAPLAVYGVQDALGVWHEDASPGPYRNYYPWIRSSWVPMELAAIVAGLVAVRFYRAPFILMVVGVALYFLSMDVVAWFLEERGRRYDWQLYRIVSIWFGLAILAIAWIVDYARRQGDLTFWLHLFGLIMFWGGITGSRFADALDALPYGAIHVVLLAIAVLLNRRSYAVFGGLGLAIYLGHLAYEVFENSYVFSFALSAIGMAVIGLGVLYHRRQAAIGAWLERALPAPLLRLHRARAG